MDGWIQKLELNKNTMRKNIVAGNWKMNNDLLQTENLLSELNEKKYNKGVQIMVAPAFTNLWNSVRVLEGSDIEVIAQNMHFAEDGAYTGEISANMLKSVGVSTVIIGHSERREYFNEDDEILKKKVDAALEKEMRLIFCFGEKIENRELGHHFDVVRDQVKNTLFHLKDNDWSSVILAYEPVWAIGTGETATPEQAQEMHYYVRNLIGKNYSEDIANEVSILYGGSVKPDNAREIFSKADVDGGLIGGASLDASSFSQIVNSF
jgi:triosephosphate isomerase